MSVLIKGVKIPKSCWSCFLRGLSEAIGCEHVFDLPNELTGRSLQCPLIELPDHGDLIDRDKVLVRTMDYCDLEEAILLNIMEAPAVIPAERSEE